MKFVTALVAVLYAQAAAAAVDTTTTEKETLVKPPAVHDPETANDVVVPDVVVGSNPNQSSTNDEATSTMIAPADYDNTVASMQSFKLRASASAATLNKQLVQAPIDDEDKSKVFSAAADAIRGTAALMEEAKLKSETIVEELQKSTIMQQQERGNDGWKEHILTTYQSAIDQVDEALETFPTMLSYLEPKEEVSPQRANRGLLDAAASMESEEDMEMVTTNGEGEDFHQSPTESSSSSSSSTSSSSESTCDWKEDHTNTLHHHKKEAAKSRRILRSHVEGHSHGTTHLDRVSKFQQTLEAGDYAGVHQHLGPIKSKVSRAHNINDKRRRRLITNANEAKAKQCKIFMECVGQMSIYDMILYYFSDDIDDTSGEIDDNIYRHISAPDVYSVYNNGNVVKARNNFPHNRALSWYNNAGQRTWCDNTLRLFFRNVEYGAVPHWEGATVSAVCLAQGSHTYVKLDQIATKVGFQAADEIAEEMFMCSKDLYNSNANPRKSPFPFTTQKIGINAGSSSVIERNGSSDGVTGRVTGSLDSKYKLFDSNTNTFFRSRDGDRGYPMQLKIRSDQSRCVQWDDSSSDDYLRGWSCNSSNKQKWFYDKRTKQIRSRHDQNDCMQAKSSGGNDKIRVRDCDSGDGHQRWTEYADYGIKNERRNKCMQKGGDHSMYVRGCDGDHDQDFLQVHQNNFFTKMIPPSVEFRVQFSVFPTNVQIKGIEIKWKNGEECPRNNIVIKEGFNGGNMAFVWGSDSLSGSVNTWTVLPVSSTTNRFRIFCNNPHKRIAVYEIVVYGSLSGGSGTLPKFTGNFDEFHIPTGVEMGTTARDNYGQVKGQSVTLYKYEGGPVDDMFEALQTTMVGTMKKIWDHWLKSGSDNLRLNLRQRYTNPYSNSNYKNSDDFIRMVGEGEDDDDIKKQMVAGYSRQTRGSYNSANHDDREEEFDEFNDDIVAKYGAVQDGFNMVFGKDASVGYVCGIESAVSKGGASKFPGSCCLDAPFQNPGGEWGREFDCTMQCITKAPFFSGLSEDSCSAVGGTWCPGPTNCLVLKNCINAEIKSATTANKMAYVAYLEPGKVENHLDFDDCGNAREYFGFDELYKNDEDVCENIAQLANTKDFDFLDEVYAQGTPLASSPGGDWEDLKDVNTKQSQSNFVQDGPVKFGLMYGLGIIRDTVGGIKDAISEFKCPKDTLMGTTCTSVTNIAYEIIHVFHLLLTLGYNAWEYTHAVTDNTNNIQPIEDWEILQYQHRNNKIMHEGAEKIYEMVANMEHSLLGAGTSSDSGKIGEILDCLKNPGSCQGSRKLMSTGGSNAQFAGCDGRDQDGDHVIDNCEEDHFPPQVSGLSTLGVQDDGNTKMITSTVFPSIEEALSALQSALSVVDDCAAKEDLALNLTVKESNECQTVVAAAPIHRCNDITYLGKTEELSVTVDSKPPTIKCRFQSGQHKKILFVEEGEGFFDAGLSLQVEDTCSDKIDVQVSVMSNEYDTNGPNAYLNLAEDGNDHESSKVIVPELFLKQATCSGAHQHKTGGICQKSPVGSRVYKLTVDATDAAGWSASDTCHVIVTPKKEEERELLLREDTTPEEVERSSGTQWKLESMNYVHRF